MTALPAFAGGAVAVFGLYGGVHATQPAAAAEGGLRCCVTLGSVAGLR